MADEAHAPMGMYLSPIGMCRCIAFDGSASGCDHAMCSWMCSCIAMSLWVEAHSLIKIQEEERARLKKVLPLERQSPVACCSCSADRGQRQRHRDTESGSCRCSLALFRASSLELSSNVCVVQCLRADSSTCTCSVPLWGLGYGRRGGLGVAPRGNQESW